MKSAAELWREYHAAAKSGNSEAARNILKVLHNYSGTPAPRGGCAKCRKSFY